MQALFLANPTDEILKAENPKKLLNYAFAQRLELQYYTNQRKNNME